MKRGRYLQRVHCHDFEEHTVSYKLWSNLVGWLIPHRNRHSAPKGQLKHSLTRTGNFSYAPPLKKSKAVVVIVSSLITCYATLSRRVGTTSAQKVSARPSMRRDPIVGAKLRGTKKKATERGMTRIKEAIVFTEQLPCAVADRTASKAARPRFYPAPLDPVRPRRRYKTGKTITSQTVKDNIADSEDDDARRRKSRRPSLFTDNPGPLVLRASTSSVAPRWHCKLQPARVCRRTSVVSKVAALCLVARNRRLAPSRKKRRS